MSDTFTVDSLPFSFLTEEEKTLLLSHVQPKVYQPSERLISAGEVAQGLLDRKSVV